MSADAIAALVRNEMRHIHNSCDSATRQSWHNASMTMALQLSSTADTLREILSIAESMK